MSMDTLRADTPPRPRDVRAWSSPTLARNRTRDLLDSRWGIVAALLLLTLASLWLRVEALRFHYWIDEGLSVGIASHPLSRIPSLLRQDGSPPLYYLLLHMWMGLRGRSEVATHELSLAFALLTIPVSYWAGRSIFGRRAGLICAALAAGTPFLTTFGQETRMYALLALLALVVAGSFVHVFVLRHRRYLPLFVVSLTASLYTHNWALFLGLMAGAAYLACARRAPDPRAMWRDGALAFGAVALLYLPWLPTLIYQAAHTGAPWSDRPVIWSLTQGSYALVGGRGVAVALLLAGGSGLLALRGTGRSARLTIISLVLLGVGTVLLAWLYSKLSPAWAVRYLAVIIGPLILLFGIGLSRAGRLGLAALALVGAFWLVDPRPHSLDSKSNVASAISALRPKLTSGMLVLSTQPEQVPNLAVYLPPDQRFATPVGRVPDPRVVDWRGILGRLRHSSIRSTLLPMLRTLAPGSRVLLVTPLYFPKHPPYLNLIRTDSTLWARALNHDRQYVQVATTSRGSGQAAVPVRVTLYVRRDATGLIPSGG